MDTKEVLDFLKQIADQLGPMGQEAFKVVAARVFAESIVGTVIGILLCVAGLLVIIPSRKAAAKATNTSDKEMAYVVGGAAVLALTIMGLTFLSMNVINLFSLEYATIERILNLVGNAKK